MDAQDAAKTHYCTVPGCTNEARSDRGLYSKCDEHRAPNVGNRAPRSSNGNGSLAERISSLSSMAKKVDRAKAIAKKKTEIALAAKKASDDLEREFRDQMRAIGMPTSVADHDA